MIRDNCAPDEADFQGRSNVIPFPWRGPNEAELRAAIVRARSLAELQALGARWFCAVRLNYAGPNAVWRNDSIDGDDDLPESAPERPNRYPFHEATNIYPMMSGQRLKDFAADIKAKGLLKRIVLCKNKDGVLAVLDGRTRYDICLELGIKHDFIEYKDNDPEGYLVSANLMRNDRSDLQRNLIAARTVTAKGGGDRNTLAKKSDTSTPATCGGGGKPKERTIEEAAAIYRLNSAGVERARTIIENSIPQFIDRIDSDHPYKLSIKAAHDLATLTNVEKLDGLTVAEKQRQWLKDNSLFRRSKKPPLSPFDSFVRKWRYLSPEDQRRFAMDFALPWLIEQARMNGATEIAIGDANIILTEEGHDP